MQHSPLKDVAIERAALWFAANRDNISRPVISALIERFGLSTGDAARAISQASQMRDVNRQIGGDNG